ncbi:MAG: endonuclease [Synergistaceae bacterium]|jgi:hypothetical protein|nr:endonuclease [Synergistaceae bacterium]
MGHDAERQVNPPAACCGIDPGREKFGLAVGNTDELIFSAIAPVLEFETAVLCIARGDFRSMETLALEGIPPRGLKIQRVFLGGGTGHRLFSERLDEGGVNHIVVSERETTLEGRGLYWRLHPPSGLWRLVPRSLRTPPRPVDDMAAWAIIARGIANIY